MLINSSLDVNALIASMYDEKPNAGNGLKRAILSVKASNALLGPASRSKGMPMAEAIQNGMAIQTIEKMIRTTIPTISAVVDALKNMDKVCSNRIHIEIDKITQSKKPKVPLKVGFCPEV